MDYSHIEAVETFEDVQKCVITDRGTLILDSQGRVKWKQKMIFDRLVTNICSNNFITVFIAMNGVFTIGTDLLRQGLLGCGRKSVSKIPHRLDLEGLYIDCSISTTHAALIGSDGSLVVWGNLSHMGFQSPKPIILTTQLKATQISCGQSFTAINTTKGSVYILKSNTSGFKLLSVTKDLFIHSISGNDNFLAALSYPSRVFLWIYPGSTQQLDLPSEARVKSIVCSWKGILAMREDSCKGILWTYKESKIRAKQIDIPDKAKIFAGWKISVVREKKSNENSFRKVREGRFVCKGCGREVEVEGLRHSDRCLRCLKMMKRVKGILKSPKNVEKITGLVRVMMGNTKFAMKCMQVCSIERRVIDKRFGITKMFTVLYKVGEKFKRIELLQGFSRLKVKKFIPEKPYYILSKILRKKKCGYFREILENIRGPLRNPEVFIYFFNSITLIVMKIRFRLKFEALRKLKIERVASLFTCVMNLICLEKIYSYFTVIKFCYFEGCINNLINIIDDYRTTQIFEWKFKAFSEMQETTQQLKKKVISIERLLINQKLKKEQEVIALKESQSAPRLFTNKKRVFCVKSVSSLQDSKPSICSTERRLEYSQRLSQKIQKKLESRKSLDFTENSFKRFSSSEHYLLFKSLYRPISRIFTELILRLPKLNSPISLKPSSPKHFY